MNHERPLDLQPKPQAVIRIGADIQALNIFIHLRDPKNPPLFDSTARCGDVYRR